MFIDPWRCAEVAFRDLGVDVTTRGDWHHAGPMPPASVFSKIMYKGAVEGYKKKHPDDPRFAFE